METKKEGCLEFFIKLSEYIEISHFEGPSIMLVPILN